MRKTKWLSIQIALSLWFLLCLPPVAFAAAAATDLCARCNQTESNYRTLLGIGGAIVASLCTALGILYRASLKQQRVIITELRNTDGIRQEWVAASLEMREAIRTLASSVDRLEKKIGECPIAAGQFKREMSRRIRR